MQRLRVVSYNIHKGFSANNRRFLLQDMRKALHGCDADVVCLQEVVGDHSKHRQYHLEPNEPGPSPAQFEYLADSMWPHYAYGKNAIYQAGDHGNAILSAYPFSQWQNDNISRYWFSQRGLLYGRIGQHLHIFCVHLGLLERERKQQLEQLIRCIEERVPADAGLLIAGDFNDWSLRSHRRLQSRLHVSEALSQARGKPARTFPAVLPCLRMDRIYYRNLSLRQADCMSGPTWRRLSDHCPILAEFDVPEDYDLAPRL